MVWEGFGKYVHVHVAHMVHAKVIVHGKIEVSFGSQHCCNHIVFLQTPVSSQSTKRAHYSTQQSSYDLYIYIIQCDEV